VIGRYWFLFPFALTKLFEIPNFDGLAPDALRGMLLVETTCLLGKDV
jgi:hypothetical protein